MAMRGYGKELLSLLADFDADMKSLFLTSCAFLKFQLMQS